MVTTIPHHKLHLGELAMVTTIPHHLLHPEAKQW